MTNIDRMGWAPCGETLFEIEQWRQCHELLGKIHELRHLAEQLDANEIKDVILELESVLNGLKARAGW